MRNTSVTAAVARTAHMIVMPQLYHPEILFGAHNAMDHQGISKVISKIEERQTWPAIRRTGEQYVNQCLTCQQVRDKPGDVRSNSKTSTWVFQ